MRWASFWRELKERKLVQWALGYLAGAWVIIEFADFMSATFSWPTPVLRVLTVVLAFAFLGVLVFAWYHGEKGHQRATTTEVAIFAVIAIAATAASWRLALPPVDEAAPPASATTAAEADSDLTPIVSQRPDDGRTSVAVLPLTNMSGDTANEYFSDGVTEDIIARLSQIEGLRVISRTSVMRYKNTQKTVPQIGEELGVDYVLEGSVRRPEGKVRIVAQLIEARTDAHVWTKTYDLEMSDILAVQSEVAEDIGSELKAELTPDVLADLRVPTKVDPEAYALYAKGRQMSASNAPEEQANARQLFHQATQVDSTFTMAYSALAETMAPRTLGVDYMPPVAATPEMEGTLRRAMTSHPRAPEIQTLVMRRAMNEWDFERAETAARRAVQENPNYAEARHSYGMLLARTGRYDEALAQLRTALSLDPMSASAHEGLGELLYAMGRFDEAIVQLQKALALAPKSVPAHVNLGLAYQAKGMQQEAEAALRTANELARDKTAVRGYLGFVLASGGKTEEAEKILDEIMEGDPRRSRAGAAAQILTGLGETDRALLWLRRAANERSTQLLSPTASRVLAKLHDDPEFARIMRIGMPPVPGRGAPPIPPRDTSARRGRRGGSGN